MSVCTSSRVMCTRVSCIIWVQVYKNVCICLNFFLEKTYILNLKKRFEHIELPAKLLGYFLRSNKSNINQNIHIHMVQMHTYTHLNIYTTSIYLYMCYLYDWSQVYTVHADHTCIVNTNHTHHTYVHTCYHIIAIQSHSTQPLLGDWLM